MGKIPGEVIQCHDCRIHGYLILHCDGNYTISPRWKLVQVGLKTLYICPDCQAKRREFIFKKR